ncbi:CD226 antigen [Pyxicephalus adspersus]|uniref:CD226 antigen n=1 Tax=Pyxicephalus adspersus TaxID=30357 RepID=UPI003B5CCC81
MLVFAGLILLQIIKNVLLEDFVDTKVLLRKRITLDCIYSINETLIQSSWMKWNGSSWEPIVSSHQTFGTYISEKYKGKMSFLVENSSTDFSLALENVSEEDAGIYLCTFTVFPKGSVQKRIKVQADGFGEIIPSTKTTFTENSNIILTFQYTLKGNVNNMTLEKCTDGKVDTIAYCELTMHRRKQLSYGFDYSKHSLVNCSDLQTITLSIQKASKKDEGFYRCHFYTEEMDQAVVVEMLLKPGIASLSTVLVMYGSSLLAIIVILGTALICILRKWKNWKHKKREVKPETPTFCPEYISQQTSNMEEEHIYANMQPNPLTNYPRFHQHYN